MAQIRVHIATKKANGTITGEKARYGYTLPDWSYVERDFPEKPNFGGTFDAYAVSCLNIGINNK